MALAGLVVLATGLLMWLVLPAGSRGTSVWSLTRHDWGEVHLYASLTVLGLVALHLALNWSWVCNVGLRLVCKPDGKLGWSKLVNAAALAAVVGGGLIAFLLAANYARVDADGEGRHGHGGHAQRHADPPDAEADGWSGPGLGPGSGARSERPSLSSEQGDQFTPGWARRSERRGTGRHADTDTDAGTNPDTDADADPGADSKIGDSPQPLPATPMI